jgi:ribosomal protein S18 acetylase RimI-like enzyme
LTLQRNREARPIVSRTAPRDRIRPGRLDDAAAILDAQATSWAATYRGQLPEHVFPKAGNPRAIRFWQEVLMRGDTATRVVEEHGGRLLGFASGGSKRDPNLGARAEIYALYLRPEAQGRGLGRRLLQETAQVLRARGAPTLGLWVLASNAPAKAFYTHLGGVPGRRQVSRERGVEFDEIAYVWDPIDGACG